MKRPSSRLLVRNLQAVVLVVLASLIRIRPLQALGAALPWLTFYPAIAIAGVNGGLSSGLLATGLSCVAVGFLWPLFSPGRFVKSNLDYLEMLVFILTGCVISALSNAMRRAQARLVVYRTLVNLMDEGFCVVEMLYDPEGVPTDYRFMECNPAFEEQTGLLQAEGKTIRQMVPDHDSHWFEIYAKVARTGEEVRFENSAIAMQRYYDVFAFRAGGEGSNRVGILFKDISARKKNEQKLIHAALYDKLTGLPNRALFEETLSKALARSDRAGKNVALLFLDIDDFKSVKDTFGHKTGDRLLCSIAQRLQSNVRAGDLVSSFGGNEFALILEDCDLDGLPVLSERLIKEVESPIHLNGETVRVCASIGIVTYPESSTYGGALFQKANAAMYAAKNNRGIGLRPEDEGAPQRADPD